MSQKLTRSSHTPHRYKIQNVKIVSMCCGDMNDRHLKPLPAFDENDSKFFFVFLCVAAIVMYRMYVHLYVLTVRIVLMTCKNFARSIMNLYLFHICIYNNDGMREAMHSMRSLLRMRIFKTKEQTESERTISGY